MTDAPRFTFHKRLNDAVYFLDTERPFAFILVLWRPEVRAFTDPTAHAFANAGDWSHVYDVRSEQLRAYIPAPEMAALIAMSIVAQ